MYISYHLDVIWSNSGSLVPDLPPSIPVWSVSLAYKLLLSCSGTMRKPISSCRTLVVQAPLLISHELSMVNILPNFIINISV